MHACRGKEGLSSSTQALRPAHGMSALSSQKALGRSGGLSSSFETGSGWPMREILKFKLGGVCVPFPLHTGIRIIGQ